MRYCISDQDRTHIDHLKLHMPTIIGDELKKVIKTSKFEDTYRSRAFKKPVIINKNNLSEDSLFKLTFREFLRIENGSIVYTKTPNDYINKMIDNAILKFNLFKSFVYKEIKTGKLHSPDGFNTLKFDLILHIHAYADSYSIIQLQINSYYSLLVRDYQKFYMYIKNREFANNAYVEIRYDAQGVELSISNLSRFIKVVEEIWESPLDFNNLNISAMKATTEMLLI